VNPRVASFVRQVLGSLRERIAAELDCPDPDATARVLTAIAQGAVVQRNLYGDDFDAEEFRRAALALVS
jgi:BetI-type transcriptional repressor, C-terminal